MAGFKIDRNTEILQKAVKDLQLRFPVKTLSEKINYDKGNVSNFLKGNKTVPDEFLDNFFTTFDIDRSKYEIYNTDIILSKDGVRNPIPYYNLDFNGGWESEEIFSQPAPDFYINNPEFDRSEFACNLVGNSISRRIPSRSIIGLKLIEDWQTYFPTNELYGIVMKNELRTVKIVKRSKEKKGYLTLIPDPLPEHNQIQYEAEEVPMEFVVKFYQIVAWAQFERIAQ